jgi:hypothetical protein
LWWKPARVVSLITAIKSHRVSTHHERATERRQSITGGLPAFLTQNVVASLIDLSPVSLQKVSCFVARVNFHRLDLLD